MKKFLPMLCLLLFALPLGAQDEEITTDEKAIVNVGSIGQPRDRDPRLCYTIMYQKGESPEGYEPPKVEDDEYLATLEFIRLEYDIEKAAQKIYDTTELDDFLGARLFEGR